MYPNEELGNQACFVMLVDVFLQCCVSPKNSLKVKYKIKNSGMCVPENRTRKTTKRQVFQYKHNEVHSYDISISKFINLLNL